MQAKEMKVYLNGDYISESQAYVSVGDRGFLFADGAYEVVRSYGGALFELEAHMARLRRSLREIRIDEAAAGDLGRVCTELLEMCGLSLEDSLIYMQVTRGAAQRTHVFPSPGTVPTVYVSARPFVPPLAKRESGVAVILVPDTRWSRCDIKSIALLPNILARQMAEDSGAEEAVFVRKSVVTEGASSTFCAVLSGTVVTHPESNVILPGITRKVALGLCRKSGIPVSERPVRREELERASEMMLLSTTREIMPVISYDGIEVGGGVPGPLTRRLQSAFSGVTRRP